MFYYKFNLKLPNLDWTGTKGCKKKFLKSPQWLRNIKDRKYSFYRLDTFFSDTKYIDIKVISDGGWHFSNLKTASERAQKEGLSDKVSFVLQDYRNETNKYDRIVSVGMFEHVGVKYFKTYLSKNPEAAIRIMKTISENLRKSNQVVAKYERTGIPLYIFWKPGMTESKILPAVLTEDLLIKSMQ